MICCAAQFEIFGCMSCFGVVVFIVADVLFVLCFVVSLGWFSVF